MIYLFNQTEELIDVIDEASLAEFTHTIELNQFDRASFEIPVDYKPNIIMIYELTLLYKSSLI